MNWKIPLFKMFWDEKDVKAVDSVIRSGFNWATGPETTKFEKELARYVGTEYCVTLNSGTSALHAILLAYGVGRGDEIIVPSFTFIATVNAALFVGAKPVFADIEEKTYGLDPEDVERKITTKTKVILPIHYAGCPCQIQNLKEIAEKHHLILIEDAAEAFGADINGIKTGAFGDSAIISFCQNKVITTGEGGAIVTNSQEIYEKLQLIRSHGRQDKADYFSTTETADYVSLGYNFRLSNISAALGLSQLKKADKIIRMRKEKAFLMEQKLSVIGAIELIHPPEGFSHVYQLYNIRVRNGLRDKLMRCLAKKGIMTKVYFSPIHKTHFYREVLKYKTTLPVTEKVSQEVLSLPLYPTLTTAEINLITNNIEDYFRKLYQT